MSDVIIDLNELFTYTTYDFHDTDFWFTLPSVPEIAVDGVNPARGSNPVVQTFFEGPEKCECCINWVEKQPMEIPEVEKDRYDKAAICLYRRKDHKKKNTRMGGLIAMTDNRLVLQSQRLIDLVRPDLAKSGFLLPTRGEVEFLAPFKELYFSFTRICQNKQRLVPDTEDWRYMNLLVDVMCSLLSNTSGTVSKLLSKSSIDYHHLWTIFSKNTVVYCKMWNQDMLAQVVEVYTDYEAHKSRIVGIHRKEHTERTEVGLRVRYQYMAFDGVNFGLIKESRLIRPFEGDKLITSLTLYPVGFHSQTDITNQLCERGARILDFQDMVYCEYEGMATNATEYSPSYVTGRVVVNTFRFSVVHPEAIEQTEAIKDNIVNELLAQGNNVATPTSFARYYTTSLRPDNSILAAKGSGLAVLLSGPLGTGKTLTAEVIAEEARLPLYRVLAGELGSTPLAIEAALGEILELASAWQCVVLLDEVDTFIVNRKSTDRTSSEIVSIFLRRMEYYRGIIFLTTNLPGNIDNAFRSRCRLHLQYQPLGQTSRTEIWKLNFHRAGLYDRSRLASTGRPIEVVLTDAQLETISSWKLSGRDIHNIVQNVVLWSIADGSDVTLEKLNTSIKLTVPYASKTSFEPTDNETPGVIVQPTISSSAAAPGSRKRARPSEDEGLGSDINLSRKPGRPT